MFFNKSDSVIEYMLSCDVLKIDAEKLRSSPVEIRVTNKSEDWIAFKLSFSNQEFFRIKPCSSNILGPGYCQLLEICLQPNYDDDKNYYHVHLEAAVCAWKPKKGAKFNVSDGWKGVEPKDVAVQRFPIRFVEIKEQLNPFEIWIISCAKCDQGKGKVQKVKTVMARMQQDGSIPDGLVFLLAMFGVGVLIGYATTKQNDSPAVEDDTLMIINETLNS